MARVTKKQDLLNKIRMHQELALEHNKEATRLMTTLSEDGMDLKRKPYSKRKGKSGLSLEQEKSVLKNLHKKFKI